MVVVVVVAAVAINNGDDSAPFGHVAKVSVGGDINTLVEIVSIDHHDFPVGPPMFPKPFWGDEHRAGAVPVDFVDDTGHVGKVRVAVGLFRGPGEEE